MKQTDFVKRMENLKRRSSRAYGRLNDIPREKWTQAWDGGRRYGHMTSNLVECVNGVLKKCRHLPVAALVKCTYYKLATMFAGRAREAQININNGHEFTEFCTRQLEEGKKKAVGLNVHMFDPAQRRGSVKDIETNKKGQRTLVDYRVILDDRWCDCGKFQANRFPCEHAIAVCNAAYVDYKPYVDDLYKNTTWLRVYEFTFVELPHPDYWTDRPDYELWPDIRRRRDPKGRPQSRRIRNDMDEVEESHPPLCHTCWQPGHNVRTCPRNQNQENRTRR